MKNNNLEGKQLIYPYFQNDLEIVRKALESVNIQTFEQLVSDVCAVLNNQNKVIITGAGKNYPICQKVADSMRSIGLQVFALGAYEALHGSMGFIRQGDLLIILSKSGETKELVTFLNCVREKVDSYLITFTSENKLSGLAHHQITMKLEAEGDMWNMIPGNSTTASLMLLQTLTTQVQKRLELDLERDFLSHHPGGYIGEKSGSKK